MSAGLQQLDFMVSLIDKVSGPAGKMMTTMDTVTTNIQSGYKKIGYGAAGLVGVGFALDKILQPAKEMDRALGELKSMNVASEALDKLKAASVDFTNAYSGSASQFVASSYDIQSAVSGLNPDELTGFTVAGATLAKATKADMGTVTDYIGTMYNVFEKNANKMGKAQWVNQLAGQTATAVQIFKTTGNKLSASFMNVGGTATEMGVSMAEQYAVIGQLSGTMTGERAGTAYKALLQSMGKAEKTLGISLEDKLGNLLPMADILDKVNSKIAGMGAVAKANALSEIFGGKQAVQAGTLLLNSTDALRKNTELLGQQTGLEKAMTMANAIADPFEKATAQVNNLQLMMGNTLMPVIHELLNWFGKIALSMGGWIKQYPVLTQYLGYAVIGITGVIASLSLLSIGMGIGTMLSGGFSIAMLAFNAAMAVAKLSVFSIIPAIWGFTTALLANPMTWVVIGVVALGAALVGLVVYWDDITAAIGRFFDKISSLSGIKDLLTGLIPDFILNLMADDEGVKPTGTKMPESIGTAAQTPNAQAGGGVINRISNASSTNNSRSIGGVTVNNYGQAMNGQQLADEMAFLAG